MIGEVIKLVVVLSIWTLGLTIITQPGMLLYAWRLWGNKMSDEGHRWIEPLILCHWCMPSLHSIFVYPLALAGGIVQWDWRLVLLAPVVMMGASLINGMVWGLHQLVEAVTEFYKKINEDENAYNYEQEDYETSPYGEDAFDEDRSDN